MRYRAKVQNPSIKISLTISLVSISAELIIPAKDIAIAILKIFEPIIFPTIKSTLPFSQIEYPQLVQVNWSQEQSA